MKIERSEEPKKPAFKLRYYWTWDFWTNWVLDAPGVHNYYAFGFGPHPPQEGWLKTGIGDYGHLFAERYPRRP